MIQDLKISTKPCPITKFLQRANILDVQGEASGKLRNRILEQRGDLNGTPPVSHGRRRERWIAVAVFARGKSLDQIVGQQLASISLVPSVAPSGSEPFYRRVSGRLRLAGQLVRRQKRSLMKPPRKFLG